MKEKLKKLGNGIITAVGFMWAMIFLLAVALLPIAIVVWSIHTILEVL